MKPSRLTILTSLALTTFCMLLCTFVLEACGVKGPPLPPVSSMPIESPLPHTMPMSSPGVTR